MAFYHFFPIYYSLFNLKPTLCTLSYWQSR